jgi:hypothetical protein
VRKYSSMPPKPNQGSHQEKIPPQGDTPNRDEAALHGILCPVCNGPVHDYMPRQRPKRLAYCQRCCVGFLPATAKRQSEGGAK